MLTSQPSMISPTTPILMHQATSAVSQDSQGSGSEKSDSCESISCSFKEYSPRHQCNLVWLLSC